VLVKNPENLTPRQAAVLEAIRRDGGGLWRAYQLKESLRGLFAGNLSPEEARELLDRWCERAAASGMRTFASLAATVRRHAEGILAGIRLGLTNARAEALNTKVRLITRRAYGVPLRGRGAGSGHVDLRTRDASSSVGEKVTHIDVRSAINVTAVRTRP
jgi:transposase